MLTRKLPGYSGVNREYNWSQRASFRIIQCEQPELGKCLRHCEESTSLMAGCAEEGPERIPLRPHRLGLEHHVGAFGVYRS